MPDPFGPMIAWTFPASTVRFTPFRIAARKSVSSANFGKSKSTLRRAKKGKCALTKEPSERIYDVSRVIDQAAKTFRGDGAAVARFLNRPNPILEGRTPFEVARSSSPGAEVVVKLLRKARDGVAV